MKRFFTHLSLQAAPVRIVACLVLLAIAWLPVAAALLVIIPDANTANIGAMVLLFGLFLLWIRYWGQQVHHESQVFRCYGLVWNRQGGLRLLVGLGLGIASLSLMMLVQAGLGWVTLTPANLSLAVVLEGLVVGLGVGFAEELFFRGWLLAELQRDYSPRTSLWSNGLIFALLHFLKPVDEMIRTAPAFPGLLLLGMVLVWAKWESAGQDGRSPDGYLGLPVGLHGGLVWASYLCFVGQVVEVTRQVPSWVTGLDGNPLAGAMGLGFLAILAGFIRRRSPDPQPPSNPPLSPRQKP